MSGLTVEEVRDVVGVANEYEKKGRGVRVHHDLGFTSKEMDSLVEAGWKFRVSNVGDLVVWPRSEDLNGWDAA